VNALDSLVHPDRLAIEEDIREVNRLHQYVRKDLLEIFVVPQVIPTVADNADNDDSDEETANDTNNNRSWMITRSCPIPVSSVTAATAAQRHYPGHVGLR
jgi:hypothetical protein